MIIVRHGLMIVGYSFGAKTAMYRTLGAALGMMKERGAKENAVSYYVLNPKYATAIRRATPCHSRAVPLLSPVRGLRSAGPSPWGSSTASSTR
jgi:hypothetical protein